MSDTNQLEAAFDAGELLRPSPDVANLVDLSNAIATIAGVEAAAATPNSRKLIDAIGPCEHLVFVAADGLGMNAVKAMAPGAFIPGHLAAELRTVFPSSTPVVFASLATGKWPSEHAVTGWHMYLSEVDCVATIIRFIRRSDEKHLGELGFSGQQAFPVPSMTRRFRRNTLAMLPEEIANTVYSKYTAGGRPQRGYVSLHQAVDAVIARVSGATRPTFTSLYTYLVDWASHEHGTGHEKVRAAAGEVDREIERLSSGLPEGARVVMTADHGLLDADEPQVHEIQPSDDLTRCLVTEPWGDSRGTSWRVRPGHEAAFERAFQDRFGSRFYLITVDEAESLGLYGPGRLSSLTRRRLGSYISISKGADSIWYRAPKAKKEEEPRMVAHHSGLSPEEMLVPLVVA